MAQFFHGNIFTCRTINLRILFPMEDFISSFCVLTIGIAYVSVTDLCLEVCVRVLGYSYHLTLAYSAYPYTRLMSKCYMLFPPLFYHRIQFFLDKFSTLLHRNCQLILIKIWADYRFCTRDCMILITEQRSWGFVCVLDGIIRNLVTLWNFF